jgi:hypothetical protein
MALLAALSVLPAQGESVTARWSLRAGGGAGLLGWGDVEALKDSYSRQIRYAASQWGIETAGSCANPRIGWQAEVEVRFDLSRRFSLGLAWGLNRRSGETVLTADLPPLLTSRHAWSQSTGLTTMALNAYWNLPLSNRSGAYVTAGAGIGSAVWRYKIRDEETIDTASWEQVEGTARDRGPLVRAGIGYEFRIAKRWLMFAEIRGQLLSLGDWRTEQTTSTDATSAGAYAETSETPPDKLWLAEVAASGGRPAQALLLASMFSPDPRLYDGARPFRLNFSGAVFQVGVRLELGSRPDSSKAR